MKNALTIASEKLCKPSKKWKPADKPEMLLLLYCVFLKNLFYYFFSSVFSIIGIIALVLRKEVETTDFVRFFFLVLAGGSVFLLNEDLNINVPLEIIDLSKRATSVSGFWNGLNEYGKNLSLSLISSSILIGASIILIIFAAFRELSYSLANKNMSGFWFISLKITNLFRIQALGSGGVITLILALTFLTLNGYVFHFEWN